MVSGPNISLDATIPVEFVRRVEHAKEQGLFDEIIGDAIARAERVSGAQGRFAVRAGINPRVINSLWKQIITHGGFAP